MATVSFKKDDFTAHDQNGNEYTCNVVAEAEYSYSPGRMNMPNGDWGYPDNEEIEKITSLQINNISPEVNDEKIINQIEANVIDQLFDMDIDCWDSDEEEPWLDEDY